MPGVSAHVIIMTLIHRSLLSPIMSKSRVVIFDDLVQRLRDALRGGLGKLNIRRVGGFSARRQHDAECGEMTMMRRPCRNHSSGFKAKVAVAAIKGDRTLIELAQGFDVFPNQIQQRRDLLL